jgi:hypothetical protein
MSDFLPPVPMARIVAALPLLSGPRFDTVLRRTRNLVREHPGPVVNSLEQAHLAVQEWLTFLSIVNDATAKVLGQVLHPHLSRVLADPVHNMLVLMVEDIRYFYCLEAEAGTTAVPKSPTAVYDLQNDGEVVLRKEPYMPITEFSCRVNGLLLRLHGNLRRMETKARKADDANDQGRHD